MTRRGDDGRPPGENAPRRWTRWGWPVVLMISGVVWGVLAMVLHP